MVSPGRRQEPNLQVLVSEIVETRSRFLEAFVEILLVLQCYTEIYYKVVLV